MSHPPTRGPGPRIAAAARRRLAQLTATDRWVYGAALVVALAGLLGPPTLALLDPRLPVSAHFVSGSYRDDGGYQSQVITFSPPTDPWGTPWLVLGPQGDFQGIYSAGPNGDDELGRGDDVFVILSDSALLTLYLNGLVGGVLLAAALAGVWELSRASLLSKRSPDLRVEALRVALLSAPLLLLVGGAGVAATFFLGERLDPLLDLRKGLLVPLEWAWAGTAGLLALLAALGIRASRPLESTGEGPPWPNSG